MGHLTVLLNPASLPHAGASLAAPIDVQRFPAYPFSEETDMAGNGTYDLIIRNGTIVDGTVRIEGSTTCQS